MPVAPMHYCGVTTITLLNAVENYSCSLQTCIFCFVCLFVCLFCFLLPPEACKSSVLLLTLSIVLYI